MTPVIGVILMVAAALEVAGDAVIRKGLRGNVFWLIAAGCLILGSYGVMVNTVKWDFSRLLGVYIAFFAVMSILAGHYIFKETIPAATWIGLAFIVIGGAVIQLGPMFRR